MPYFKVDDKLHSHRKTMRATVPAMGLWVLAASWCMDQQTDGWVPDYAANRLDPDATEHAAELVAAGYWHPEDRDGELGWQFHEWDGWQHSASYLNERKRRNAARMRTQRANGDPSDLQERVVRTHDADTTQNVQSTPTTTQPKKNTPAPAGADRFPEFWANYPRRIGKTAAGKAWLKAIKDTDPDAILTGLANATAVWSSSRTEPQFIPHPATWLNHGRWADEVPLPDMPSAGPLRTARQCGEDGPHVRHQWADASNAYVCLGESA